MDKHFLACLTQEELVVIQKEKELRPRTQYDLGWRPKLRKSDRRKSLSLPDIQTVRPVESAGSSGTMSIKVKAFDSPKVPVKNRFDDGQINAINKKIEEVMIAQSGLHRLNVRNMGKQKVR
jgi:hypothetical protein